MIFFCLTIFQRILLSYNILKNVILSYNKTKKVWSTYIAKSFRRLFLDYRFSKVCLPCNFITLDSITCYPTNQFPYLMQLYVVNKCTYYK